MNKDEKKFYKELGDTPKNLFEQVALDYKNETLVQNIGFHASSEEWYLEFVLFTEKQLEKIKKRLIKKGFYEENSVKSPGIHISIEVTLDDLYFEVDFSKEKIYGCFVDELDEGDYEFHKNWIEFEEKEQLYQSILNELTLFYKERRS